MCKENQLMLFLEGSTVLLLLLLLQLGQVLALHAGTGAKPKPRKRQLMGVFPPPTTGSWESKLRMSGLVASPLPAPPSH